MKIHEFQAKTIFAKYGVPIPEGSVATTPDEAGEIIFKSFSDILSLVSGTYYPPRSKKVVNLINRLKGKKFAKSTLGGCVIEERDNFVLISKELKIKKSVIPTHRARF